MISTFNDFNLKGLVLQARPSSSTYLKTKPQNPAPPVARAAQGFGVYV